MKRITPWHLAWTHLHNLLLTGLCACLFLGSSLLATPSASALPQLFPGEYGQEAEAVLPPEDCRFTPGAKCYSHHVQRPQQVFWGDTHLHTIYSFDAGAAGTRLAPADSYEFARGNEVMIDAGHPVKLSRPLDFLVVTDHSDGLGAFGQFLYNKPTDCGADQAQVDEWHAMVLAGGEEAAQASQEIVAAFSQGVAPLCIFPSAEEFQMLWQEIIDAAETYNDPGNFTAVIGYEWTSLLGGNNLHRNVIFRDNGDKASQVVPFTTDQSTDPEDLWNWMQTYETNTGGQVFAIPHNGNLSNGLMFAERDHNGNPFTGDYAQRRQLWEPIYEISQVKGTSETHPELSPDDEFAFFEVAGWDIGNLDMSFPKPTDPEDRKNMFEHEYARAALKNGLKWEENVGINPFKFGLAGATDSHIGLSAVEEDSNMGKFPAEAPSAERATAVVKTTATVDQDLYGWNYGASGFMGVWATENTRKGLFDAMKQRELYGTTGPRMAVRFFGGWDFTAADLDADPAVVGYEKGVPMGSDLTVGPASVNPTFLLEAAQDPEGASLDRIQIVKGWLDVATGETHEDVYDVEWSDKAARPVDGTGKVPPVGSVIDPTITDPKDDIGTVDTATANYTNDIGAAELKAVWTDEAFDPAQRAFYYARVLEIPTPRWTDYDKAFYGNDWQAACDAAEVETPGSCTGIPLTLQERAYTSPIWYSPA